MTFSLSLSLSPQVLNVLALGVLSVIVRSPEMIHELQGAPRADVMADQEAPALPTPLSKIDPPYKEHDLNYQHMDMSGLLYLCLIAISGMLVYGALKRKRSYLLPFFCLQLFDFAITTLTAANFLTYLRQVHRLLEHQKLPWREELLELNPQTLSIVVLVAFISVVMVKAYAIGIVWRCYKYLTMQRQNLITMLPFLIGDVNGATHSSAGRLERDYNSLLPDYDEAIAQSLKQAPPPSYSVAVNGHVQLPASSGDASIAPPPSPPPYVGAGGQDPGSANVNSVRAS